MKVSTRPYSLLVECEMYPSNTRRTRLFNHSITVIVATCIGCGRATRKYTKQKTQTHKLKHVYLSDIMLWYMKPRMQ